MVLDKNCKKKERKKRENKTKQKQTNKKVGSHEDHIGARHDFSITEEELKKKKKKKWRRRGRKKSVLGFYSCYCIPVLLFFIMCELTLKFSRNGMNKIFCINIPSTAEGHLMRRRRRRRRRRRFDYPCRLSFLFTTLCFVDTVSWLCPSQLMK